MVQKFLGGVGCWIVPIVIKVVVGFKAPPVFAVVQCAAAFFVIALVKNLISTLFQKQNNLSSLEDAPHKPTLLPHFSRQNKVIRLVCGVHLPATKVVLFGK